MVRIGESEEIVPIALVKPSERSEDENGFLITDGVSRCGDIVEMVVNDRRRFGFAQ